jgi:hypothetical protein
VIGAALVGTALVGTAAAAPLRLDLSATLGMKAGAALQATASPWSHLDLGLWLGGATDLYAFAPDTVTWGLERQRNLHLMPALSAGWSQPVGRWELGGAAVFGPEWVIIRERKTAPALDAPIDYERVDRSLHGGLVPQARRRVGEGPWSVNALLFFPLPLSPTTSPDFERLSLGVGASYQLGGS